MRKEADDDANAWWPGWRERDMVCGIRCSHRRWPLYTLRRASYAMEIWMHNGAQGVFGGVVVVIMRLWITSGVVDLEDRRDLRGSRSGSGRRTSDVGDRVGTVCSVPDVRRTEMRDVCDYGAEASCVRKRRECV